MTIDKPAGYHLSTIPKGSIGCSSKILEEVLELQDAELQGAKIMVLCELSDIYGALEIYLRSNFPEIKMDDLSRMSHITSRAFESGHRK